MFVSVITLLPGRTTVIVTLGYRGKLFPARRDGVPVPARIPDPADFRLPPPAPTVDGPLRGG